MSARGLFEQWLNVPIATAPSAGNICVHDCTTNYTTNSPACSPQPAFHGSSTFVRSSQTVCVNPDWFTTTTSSSSSCSSSDSIVGSSSSSDSSGSNRVLRLTSPSADHDLSHNVPASHCTPIHVQVFPLYSLFRSGFSIVFRPPPTSPHAYLHVQENIYLTEVQTLKANSVIAQSRSCTVPNWMYWHAYVDSTRLLRTLTGLRRQRKTSAHNDRLMYTTHDFCAHWQAYLDSTRLLRTLTGLRRQRKTSAHNDRLMYTTHDFCAYWQAYVDSTRILRTLTGLCRQHTTSAHINRLIYTAHDFCAH
jgi:hypothetical protein